MKVLDMSGSRKKTKLTGREEADHAISVYDYPDLNLGENEYILIDLQRSKLIPVLAHIGAISCYVFFAIIAFLDMGGVFVVSNRGLFSVVYLLVAVIISLFCYASIWIYNRSKIIVSNQRIFNRIQSSLFAYRIQNIELENIEDMSYSQFGIFANIFNYGAVRFSTIGNEHTYELTFVDNPRDQLKVVEKVIHKIDKRNARDIANLKAKNIEN